jgi:GTP1/Obg family GTP-binding protein
MLKDLLASLKNNQNGYSSNYLKNLGFDYLIENSTVYLLYSIKIEVDKNEFKGYIKDYLNDVKALQNNNDFYNNIIDTCYKWYCYFLENKSLVKSTSSLKSETKKIYKKYVGSLNGFDRFFEKIYNAFQEAYNCSL